MKIPWGKIAHIGAAVVAQVVPATSIVEQLLEGHGGGGGNEKQDTVLALVQNQLSTALTGVSPALLFNARVVAAIRAVIDSIVALQQTIAIELHAAGTRPAPAAATTTEP